MSTRKTTFHITQDPCPACGKAESFEGGLCLACITKRIAGAHSDDAGDGPGLRVNAGRAATAWLNAFLATSNDEDRGVLYRTLSVELFDAGVQFVGCDGQMLFRTWVACEGAPMPLLEEVPDRAVVVMDREKFALGFMRTMLAASREQESAALTIHLEPAPVATDAPTLGEAFNAEVLTLRAFGQRLQCALYESDYVNWRRLQFGVTPAERVDGMRLAVRMFGAVGKLRGVGAVDCEFHGTDRQIAIHGVGVEAEVRGLLMPMRREAAAETNDPTANRPDGPERR